MVKIDGWDLTKLKNICDFIGGGTPSKENTSFWSGNIPWISSSDLSQSSIWNVNITRHITQEAVVKSATQICPIDTILVVSRVGVGKVAVAPIELCTSQDFTNLHARGQNARFLAYYLQVKMKIMAEKTQGTSIKGVTVDDIAQLDVNLPSVGEQTAIAKALSDVDSLIFSLQKLIEKKKAIKQGAMQELLTGKKRLPGFSGEWNVVRIGETLSIGHGQSQKTVENRFGKYPILATGGCIGYADSFLWDKPSVLIGRKGTIDKPQYADYPFWTIDTLFYTKIFEEYDAKFIFYKFCIIDWQQYNEASGVPSLNAGTIENLYITVPEKYEQQAIAQILSDMDGEIERLEKKLAKYQQIKQGMMQELLTGRIRLVDADSKEQPKTQAVQGKQLKPAHNQHFDDAVMIAGIVNAFYSEKYPLGRKKVQKLLYLVRRKEQADTSAFHKKAAGPYADEVRYKGGEPIAQKNRYIQVKKSDKGSSFEKGVKIQQALTYLQEWKKQADIDWLLSEFQYTGVNELELLATVDMAMCDLYMDGKEVSVTSIKNLIRSSKEWQDKLKKTYFKDADIQRAIKRCQELF